MTVVSPTEKVSGALLVMSGEGSARSLAAAVPNSSPDTGVCSAVASLETASGAVTFGEVVSTTVTINVSESVSPSRSVTVSVIVLAPSGTVAEVVGLVGRSITTPVPPVQLKLMLSPSSGSVDPLPSRLTDAPSGAVASMSL